MALAEWSEAHECLSILDKESKWSKAIYSYGKAVTSYEDLLAKEAAGGVTEEVRKAVKLNIENNMKSVPGYLQKIAGKSLPFEVRRGDCPIRPFIACLSICISD